MVVDLYGMSYQGEKNRADAAHYVIPILEDSAEVLGSSYKGIPCVHLAILVFFLLMVIKS